MIFLSTFAIEFRNLDRKWIFFCLVLRRILTFYFFVNEHFLNILNANIIEKKNFLLMHFYGDYKS